MASSIDASTSGAGGVITTADNTGILQLKTAGTTAVTIDASQNVGIGTTSPTYKLDTVSSTNPIAKFTYSTVSSVMHNSTGSGNAYWGDVDVKNAFGINAASNYVTAWTNNAERMRIDSSGNVGIGTASPNERLTVSGGISATSQFVPYNGTTVLGYIGNDNSISGGTGTNLGIRSETVINFATGGATERMRITSGGEVYIAGTTDRGAFNLQCNGTGVWGAGAYTNGSDERIKENITPLDTGLDVVTKLNPVTYKYKEEWSKDQSIQTGFIAQDLLVALEGKNYVDGIVNQSSEYMSVAYQNIIPILTKAIQEQQTIINDLKARVTALEAK